MVLLSEKFSLAYFKRQTTFFFVCIFFLKLFCRPKYDFPGANKKFCVKLLICWISKKFTKQVSRLGFQGLFLDFLVVLPWIL